MRKSVNIIIFILIILVSSFFYGCNKNGGYRLYQDTFYDLFDTFIYLRIYAKNDEEFQNYADIIYDELQRLHRLFDIYNQYNDINNIKTINDNAGISSVTVDPDIMELAGLAVKAWEESDGAVNAAMGSLLETWHEYRQADNNMIPSLEVLETVGSHINIFDVILDSDNSTVFLVDPLMSLDFGALAKGYAVEKAMNKAAEAGMVSGLISAGGNVKIIGRPMDGRSAWNVGIENPYEGEGEIFDTIHTADMSIVTSGDYQRFYIVDGVAYHHIIDPETLMPAKKFKSVTVLHPDSSIADMLSTALFILPYDRGLLLAQEYHADALWILPDESTLMTEGYVEISDTF